MPKSKDKHNIQPIMESIGNYFTANKGDVKVRAKAINQKGKLFLGFIFCLDLLGLLVDLVESGEGKGERGKEA